MATTTESDKKVGKRCKTGDMCSQMFCSKSAKDGVSIHKAPDEPTVRKLWIDFVSKTREDVDKLKKRVCLLRPFQSY